MASPRVAAKVFNRLSPQRVQNVFNTRQTLYSKTPVKHNLTVESIIKIQEKSPVFNLDTPHRKKIINEGFLGNFRKILGNGTFGTVYKANYKGEPVAAKIIKHNYNGKNLFETEKQVAYLSHPNVVKVFKVEEGPILTLITMELCGDSLQIILDKNELSKKERIHFWKSIAKALKYCHEIGVVHADVKPKNILMGTDNQPKLADFGSAIFMNAPYNPSNFHGTPGYAAPEVVSGNKPTPLSDIYSLGVTAWQMLTRKRPFTGLHVHTILYLTGKGKKPSDSKLDDGFGGKYKEMYEQSWSKISKDRPSLNTIIKNLSQMELEIY
ncbi:serine/threonine-protein kinase mos-like [Phymastichus coffea]|uniref:serine/threonine-protein kinase mos-like n=1 Tax=Phymastichus coffea TaxID=108790 RepID=UPI00273C9C62|nr:serine/threonine-protein kinase mos-like [Phymastichus coffea]